MSKGKTSQQKYRFIAFNEGQRPKKLLFKSTKKKILKLKEYQHFHQLNNRDTRILIIEYFDGSIQKFSLKDLSNDYKTTQNKRIVSFWLENDTYFQKSYSDTSKEIKEGSLSIISNLNGFENIGGSKE